VVGIADYANTFATNNLTVGRNGSNIGGVATNAILSTSGLSVTFVYVDATQGWIVTDSGNRSDLPTPQFVTATGGTILTCGNFKTHVFTGPGTFTVSCAGNANGSNSVEYLVVAGGAGGGGRHGGGGGAGGFRQNYPSPAIAGLPVTAQGYPITVGSGGAAGTYPLGVGVNGGQGNPAVFSTITSTGGGGGGTAASSTPCGATTLAGGSGGGGAYCGPSNAAGNGNTPPVSPPQGNPGGAGVAGPPYDGGGGGGASAAGTAGSSTGNGGAGSPIATTLFGPTAPSYGTSGPAPGRYFAGGGGGGGYSCAGGTGGDGGGGNSGRCNARPGVAIAGTVNTGGGGGGAGGIICYPGLQQGAAGGSGIVVIRYKFQ
jgi:hypothetical protein